MFHCITEYFTNIICYYYCSAAFVGSTANAFNRRLSDPSGIATESTLVLSTLGEEEGSASASASSSRRSSGRVDAEEDSSKCVTIYVRSHRMIEKFTLI